MRRGVIVTGLAAALGLGAATGELRAQETPPTEAASPAVRAAPRHSWFSDRRAFGVGDVITVLVDEYTLATANKSNLAAQDRSRRNDLGAGGGMGETSFGPIDATLRSSNATSSRERGTSSRQDRLASEITVRVVSVEPSGLLKVEGTKKVRVDDHEQQVTLRGWVRPEDVSANNVLESWRVGDAEISYVSEGDLGKPKGGILGRILGMLWP